MKRLALLFLSLFLFAGCGAPKRVVVVPKDTYKLPPSKCKYTYTVNGKRYCVRKNHKGFVQVGIASWYGPGFHGSRTASGEIYNMYKLTAAHKTLPLGTYVKVVNLENGKSVIVKVNDRGPFVEGRIIDLSYAAAKKIGMLKKGTARVKIVALGRRVDHTYKPVPYTRGRFFVQVGAFRNKFNAYRFRWELSKKGLKARVAKLKGYYRVLVGPVSTYEGAKRLKRELLKRGFHGSFIVAL
ncbi:septal ring lytic transglycosylase RlpA family protein [Thermovibrio sp.]